MEKRIAQDWKTGVGLATNFFWQCVGQGFDMVSLIIFLLDVK
jgi:hypothetical protein